MHKKSPACNTVGWVECLWHDPTQIKYELQIVEQERKIPPEQYGNFIARHYAYNPSCACEVRRCACLNCLITFVHKPYVWRALSVCHLIKPPPSFINNKVLFTCHVAWPQGKISRLHFLCRVLFEMTGHPGPLNKKDTRAKDDVKRYLERGRRVTNSWIDHFVYCLPYTYWIK